MVRELIVGPLRVPVEKDGPGEYIKAAAALLELPEAELGPVRILGKALDSGDPEQFYYELSLAVRVPEGYANRGGFPECAPEPAPLYTRASPCRPVVVGFGPAGMFAALELLKYGLKPRIFERGRRLEERHLDVQAFISGRGLAPESNIQFGEGGAGAYSDGKLFSRVNNSSYASRVLDTFIEFGAPAAIGYLRKPHLGTDVLCRIVANIRGHILKSGGEIHYGSKMTDILVAGGAAAGVVINGTQEYPADAVYLAVGNSARDTFSMLHEQKAGLEAKPVSVGVRVEHPAAVINLIRYGKKYKDFPGLGAATYSFNYTDRKTGRGAYTFCMCPGGEVVNASSEEGLLALNGMSYAARNSPYSNSAIVVPCRTDDYGSTHPLAGVEFQKKIERAAFLAGGGGWKAPAQKLTDFLEGRRSSGPGISSYRMGLREAELASLFPPFIGETLRAAFGSWRAGYPLFAGGDAVLIGPETRTSAPVRMLRGANFESLSLRKLYPIGEGSGYSGGIASSASDAIKAVEAAQR